MDKQEITYSRHVRNRMNLYRITEEDVKQAITEPDKGPEIEADRYVVFRTPKGKFKGMPLKVIYVLARGKIVVVSAYPVKKSYRR